MLLSSLIRKTLGVKDHRVQSVEESSEGLIVRLVRKRNRKLPCSICNARCWTHSRLHERVWRHVPLWGIQVRLCYTPHRVRCKNCGVKVERIPWGPSKSPISLPLIILLATWAKLLAVDVAARLFGVCWATVGSAVKQAVAYGLENRDMKSVRILGIDEISRKKGHVYHTQVYDLETKRLLWSQEGRSVETLKAFFEKLGPERTEKIEGVCCDMWAPYVETIKEMCPQAVLVFDEFHIVRHLLKAVDQVRKDEVRQWKKKYPTLLAKTKYIWLKNPWNLTPKQKRTLGFYSRLNLRIHKAYLLKEMFRDLWSYQSKGWAKKYLKKWFWWATHSRIKPLRDFAWMLRRHEEGILNYFKLRIDNGAVEAMNNVAKSISHRAHGFRSEDWFSTILLHCMGDMPMPVFSHRFS